MLSFSRRQLAHYAVEQLAQGKSLRDVSRQLAAALTAAKKQGDADLLMSDISGELESRGLLANATVTTASGLSAGLRRELATQIEKAASVDKVVMDEQIDKDIIGGFRVETANHTWDKTIKRRLADIKGGI